MAFKRLAFVCVCMVVLSGCQSAYDVKLNAKEFEYEKNKFDVCQVIDEINGTKIRDFYRSDGKIEKGEYHVSCPKMEIKNLGKQEVNIQINNSSVSVNLEIKDTTPPEISIQKSSYEVEKGNQYFDIKKLVSIKDAYDPHPVVGFSGEVTIDVPGTYSVTVTAQDSKKNKAQKRIEVVVTEKEVQVVEKQVLLNNGASNNASQPTTGSNGSSSIPYQNQVNSSLPSKEWLFTQGYDMQTGFKACQDYRGSNAGSCSPLQNGDGPYGYIYNP